MILRKEALSIVARTIVPTTVVESVPLIDAVGRVLATDAIADIDAPPFDRVTMDGYAVVASDGPGEYEVVDYIPAGAFPTKTIESKSVARIMTGAPLPPGTDAVVPVEKTGGFVDVGQVAQIDVLVTAGQNVASQGEDFKRGDILLTHGTVITTGVIPALAVIGVDPVPVYCRPTIGILTTGDELVPPSQQPAPGQIRNSNAYSIYAQALNAGALPTILDPARDEKSDLADKINDARNRYDFLIVSGGVSAGDRDFVPETVSAAGYNPLFTKIRIKPGKPTLFGVTDDRHYIFGLPGNPVSTFVIFELFIRPALNLFIGLPFDAGHRLVNGKLTLPYHRKSGEREEFVPAMVAWSKGRYEVTPVRYRGSGHAEALARANALFRVPQQVTTFAPEWEVEVTLLR
jgi:molybdopterin molybdotransferase